MITAIFIIILILVISAGLFFLIKKISNNDYVEQDVYAEEGVITDFDKLNTNTSNKIKDDESDISDSSPQFKFAMILGKIYAFRDYLKSNFLSIKENYSNNKLKKIKEREEEIQDAVQKSFETEAKDIDNGIDDLDTSHFEVEDDISSESINESVERKNDGVNSKASDFVQQLLSDVDAVSDMTASEDISDTYYYEYMEKRYINRIVANSRDIEAYKKLGDLYVDMRNYEDALESFQYVLRLKPNDITARHRVNDISKRLQESKSTI